MDIKLIVGQNIRKLRKHHNLTQTELSSVMELSRTSISNIESGRQAVTIDNLYTFSIALKVPITMLFDGLEGEENIVEGMNVKYQMLDVQHSKLQKKHQKLIDNLSELISQSQK